MGSLDLFTDFLKSRNPFNFLFFRHMTWYRVFEMAMFYYGLRFIQSYDRVWRHNWSDLFWVWCIRPCQEIANLLWIFRYKDFLLIIWSSVKRWPSAAFQYYVSSQKLQRNHLKTVSVQKVTQYTTLYTKTILLMIPQFTIKITALILQVKNIS